jgi:hypothetical protein
MTLGYIYFHINRVPTKLVIHSRLWFLNYLFSAPILGNLVFNTESQLSFSPAIEDATLPKVSHDSVLVAPYSSLIRIILVYEQLFLLICSIITNTNLLCSCLLFERLCSCGIFVFTPRDVLGFFMKTFIVLEHRAMLELADAGFLTNLKCFNGTFL